MPDQYRCKTNTCCSAADIRGATRLTGMLLLAVWFLSTANNADWVRDLQNLDWQRLCLNAVLTAQNISTLRCSIEALPMTLMGHSLRNHSGPDGPLSAMHPIATIRTWVWKAAKCQERTFQVALNPLNLRALAQHRQADNRKRITCDWGVNSTMRRQFFPIGNITPIIPRPISNSLG